MFVSLFLSAAHLGQQPAAALSLGLVVADQGAEGVPKAGGFALVVGEKR
jgi:hypothetical protein